jgi:hypothetical protein
MGQIARKTALFLGKDGDFVTRGRAGAYNHTNPSAMIKKILFFVALLAAFLGIM